MVTDKKLQGNVHAKNEKEAIKMAKDMGLKPPIGVKDKGVYKGQPRLVNQFETVKLVEKEKVLAKGMGKEVVSDGHGNIELRKGGKVISEIKADKIKVDESNKSGWTTKTELLLMWRQTRSDVFSNPDKRAIDRWHSPT